MTMQRGQQSWQVSATHNGVRKRITIHDQTKTELAKQTMLNAMRDGKNIDNALANIGIFFDTKIYINAIYTQVVKAHWGKSNESRQIGNGKQVVEFFGNNKEISQIDTFDIDELIEHFEDAGNKGSTINRKLAALSKMFTFAKQRGFVTNVPHINWQDEGVGRIRYLSDIEETAMYTILQTTGEPAAIKMADLIKVAIHTGFRKSEIRRASTKDLVLQKNKEGEDMWCWSIYNTKNKLSRSIYITKEIKSILDKYHYHQPFADVNNYNIRKWWGYAKNQLKLQDDNQFVLHACRHTCASRLVQRGIHLQVVKEFMGHKSFTMTLRYAHLAPTNLQEAAKVLQQFSVAS